MEYIATKESAFHYYQKEIVQQKKFEINLLKSEELDVLFNQDQQLFNQINSLQVATSQFCEKLIQHFQDRKAKLKYLLKQSIQPEVQGNGDTILHYKEFLFQGKIINQIREGQWFYIINGEKILAGEYKKGVKVGLWREIIQNRDGKVICYEGYYDNGKKQNIWNLRVNDELMSQGKYINDLKEGEWEEFGGYFSNNLITFNGQYKEGIRIGQWNYYNQYQSKVLFGGTYENGLKEGQWVEYVHLDCGTPRTESGMYKNGKRIGEWSFQGYSFNSIKQKLGIYDENGREQGNFILNLLNSFKNSLLLDIGECKNGSKDGKWISKKDLPVNYPNQLSYGGNYQNGVKEGDWMEYYIEDNNLCKFYLEGKYENNIKQGKWILMRQQRDSGEEFGGGYYNNGLKEDIWKSVVVDCMLTSLYSEGQYCKGFKHNQHIIVDQQKQIKSQGKYNLGVKEGEWIEYPWNYQGIFYSEKGQYKNGVRDGIWNFSVEDYHINCEYKDGFKIGYWQEYISLSLESDIFLQEGNYKNGRRDGEWKVFKNDKKVGGGNYVDGYKNGNWKEVRLDNYNNVLTFTGKYKNGCKLGQWGNTYSNQFKDNKQYKEDILDI